MAQRTCSFGECDRIHKGLGLCAKHLEQSRRGKLGTTVELTSAKRKRRNTEDRFWEKVEKTESCWIWRAGLHANGYGHFWDQKRYQAHRYGWELVRGPIPVGKLLDHRCMNRACVNPDHLRLVTAKQNSEHLAGGREGSKTGRRNVYPFRGGFRVDIRHNGKLLYFGTYPTAAAAEEVAAAKRAELFTHDDHDAWLASQPA